MKIFVTGGAGFIGSHLCEELLEKGYEVVAYDNMTLGSRRNLTAVLGKPRFTLVEDDLLTDRGLEKHVSGVDLVFHLAANSDISRGSVDTSLDLKQSVLATYNLCEAMRKTGRKKLIFASTSAIYGEATLKPTPESYGPLVPISFYGSCKLGAEALISSFAHHYGIQSWVYRFANVVGGHLTHGAIYDFLGRLKADPLKLEVLGDGRQRKSYLHVSDCISGMIFGMENSKAEINIFNLASRGVTEVRFIAEQVVASTGGKAAIQFGTEDRGWKGDVPVTWLDSAKLSELGWSAKVESDEAVRRSIREVLAWQSKP